MNLLNLLMVLISCFSLNWLLDGWKRQRLPLMVAHRRFTVLNGTSFAALERAGVIHTGFLCPGFLPGAEATHKGIQIFDNLGRHHPRRRDGPAVASSIDTRT